MLISTGKMRDTEQKIKFIVDQFSLLIRQVIQNNVHSSDGIDIEDIEQEVRIKIWSFLRKGKKIKNLPSYLRRVAYSTTIDELRKMIKQSASGKPENLKRVYFGTRSASSRHFSESSPEVGLEISEAKEMIHKMINSLNDKRKRVLELYLEGLSIDEICTSLNLDRDQVRHFYYRGIDELKEKGRVPEDEFVEDPYEARVPPKGKL